MKKRILSLIMIMPFLVMLLAFGFSRTVNLFVDLAAEYLEWDYEEQQIFEFTSTDAEGGIELNATVYPLNATNKEIVWQLKEEQAFDGEGIGDPSNPIAYIENGRLYKLRDGIVSISASVSGSSVVKTFMAYLVDENETSENARFIIMQGSDTTEVSIKSASYRYFGLYNLVNGQKQLNTETYSVTVFPASMTENLTLTATNGEGCVSASMTEADEFGRLTVSVGMLNHSNGNFIVLKLSADGGAVEARSTFMVVDGVNVRSYDDLMYCTSEATPEKIVLRTNLESYENVSTRKNSALFGRDTGQWDNRTNKPLIKCEYTTMQSTYDIKYYTNQNKGSEATIRVGVTFRDDVYGNGYTINAHELTYPKETLPSDNGVVNVIPDMSDKEAWTGPLKFVSDVGCSCYGQDNIGFMVKGNNIKIDNITLKNCNNVNNLSNLDYVGTVLEVDGDNVTVTNSQIQNGRTVVRTMSNKNLKIEACLLSYAREFILKVGSNEFVYPAEGQSIPSGRENAYAFLSPDADEYGQPLAGQYKSTVTVKNSYFYTSGVFCVGMDTHFAGRYLYSRNSTIKNMAATSYPSKLTLEGDVRFYDWKTVDGLDSSTLIELPSASENEQLSALFDISAIIERYHENNLEKNIVLDKDGTYYVHGAVAFFGGGRNLSTVVFDGLNEENKSAFTDLNDPLLIGLDDEAIGSSTNRSILESAAGYGKFKFYMYNPSGEWITVGSVPAIEDLNRHAIL